MTEVQTEPKENLTPPANNPVVPPPLAEKKFPLMMIVLLFVLLSTLVLAFAYLTALNKKRQAQLTQTQASRWPGTPWRSSSPKPLTEGQLSDDDSLGTIQVELDQTQVDTFQTDLQEIEKDVNSL